MTPEHDSDCTAVLALELFEPQPDVLYSLDAAAALAGVPRRAILLYQRAGLVSAEFLPPYGAMMFTEDDIYAVRRIEHVRRRHDVDLGPLTDLIALLAEIGWLRVTRPAAAGRGARRGREL